MVEMESAAENPNYPAVDYKRPSILSFPRRPALRVTSEFDSESAVFFHKISCKLLDSLAKFKFSFNHSGKGGDISEPQFSFVSKHLSLHYDLEDHNALVKTSIDLAPSLQLTASHDLKAQQGEVTVLANLADPAYSLQLSTPLPSVGLVSLSLSLLSCACKQTLNDILSFSSMCSQKLPSDFLWVNFRCRRNKRRKSIICCQSMGFLKDNCLMGSALPITRTKN